MYTEFRDRNREGWRFLYKGKDLIPAAISLIAHYEEIETESRNTLSANLANQAKSLSSKENSALESRAKDAAVQVEQCEVFKHEFERTPDREFSLSMADVVFFGLAGHDLNTGGDN